MLTNYDVILFKLICWSSELDVSVNVFSLSPLLQYGASSTLEPFILGPMSSFLIFTKSFIFPHCFNTSVNKCFTAVQLAEYVCDVH